MKSFLLAVLNSAVNDEDSNVDDSDDDVGDDATIHTEALCIFNWWLTEVQFDYFFPFVQITVTVNGVILYRQ